VRSPALVAVEAGPAAFAPLVEAARRRGVRVGWLVLAPPPPVAGPLEEAAAAGVLRALAVGGGRAVAVKPLRGEPVLRDLVREHFLGCAIVLVQGRAGHPRLAPAPGGFRLETGPGRARDLEPEAALAELLRPRHRA
jgi:hypothetical protein